MPVILGGNTGIYLASLTPSVDPDAQAFITAAAITDPTQQAAVNTLVVDLKGYNVWSKMKALYPFVSDNRNLLSYTENFENAYWLKYNTTISANAINAPNGTLTADELNEGATSNYHGFKTTLNGLTPNSTWGASISLKYNNRRYVSLAWYIDATPYPSFSVIIDTQNKTIVSSSNTLTASIELQSNDWFRVKLTGNIGNYTNAYTFQLSLLDDSLNQIYLGTNKSVYVWGSQIEIGTSVTSYQAITFTPQSFMAGQHKFNLKDPRDLDAAFRIFWNGGVTHSSNGVLFNGTNSYGNTNLNTSSILTPNNLAISVYTNTNRASSSGIIYGNSDNTTSYIPLIELYLRLGVNNIYSDLGDYNFRAASTNINTAGYYIATRTASNSSKLFKNNSLLAQNTNTQTTNTLPNTNIYLGTFNYNNGPIVPSNVDTVAVQIFTLSDGLTDTEAANFYTAVQTFQTALSRNI